MKQFKYVIKDKYGMHARPAGLFVKEASTFASTVKIVANGKEADAKKILGVMSLGIKEGNEITVIAEGDDEEKAIASLEKFITENV